MGEDVGDELAFWKARITDIKVDGKRRVSLNLRDGISSSPVHSSCIWALFGITMPLMSLLSIFLLHVACKPSLLSIVRSKTLILNLVILRFVASMSSSLAHTRISSTRRI